MKSPTHLNQSCHTGRARHAQRWCIRHQILHEKIYAMRWCSNRRILCGIEVCVVSHAWMSQDTHTHVKPTTLRIHIYPMYICIYIHNTHVYAYAQMHIHTKYVYLYHAHSGVFATSKWMRNSVHMYTQYICTHIYTVHMCMYIHKCTHMHYIYHTLCGVRAHAIKFNEKICKHMYRIYIHTHIYKIHMCMHVFKCTYIHNTYLYTMRVVDLALTPSNWMRKSVHIYTQYTYIHIYTSTHLNAYIYVYHVCSGFRAHAVKLNEKACTHIYTIYIYTHIYKCTNIHKYTTRAVELVLTPSNWMRNSVLSRRLASFSLAERADKIESTSSRNITVYIYG